MWNGKCAHYLMKGFPVVLKAEWAGVMVWEAYMAWSHPNKKIHSKQTNTYLNMQIIHKYMRKANKIFHGNVSFVLQRFKSFCQVFRSLTSGPKDHSNCIIWVLDRFGSFKYLNLSFDGVNLIKLCCLERPLQHFLFLFFWNGTNEWIHCEDGSLQQFCH